MKIFNPTTWIFFFNGIVGATLLNPTLIPLVQSLGDLPSERVLSDVIFRYSAFLFRSLKLDGIASSHFCIAPYHMHHG
jgi:hypothetical protein